MLTPTCARIKAEALALMAEHAAIQARGWDGQRERYALHVRIDELLDQHSLEVLLWNESVPRTVA